MDRERLDATLKARGLFPTRSAARGAIIRGDVLVDGRRELRPGRRVDPDSELEIMAPTPVGRGALKLQGALERFGLDLSGKAILDVGASTGGFTETLLHAGASRVWAVDVGRRQLHPDLREDPRVVNLEGTDIRRLEPEMLDAPIDAVTVDVSFISLEKVLPSLAGILSPGVPVIALVKPQFEAGPRDVGGGGIVRDPETQVKVLRSFLDEAAGRDFHPEILVLSPILDPDANLEFFALLWYAGVPAHRGVLDPSDFCDVARRVVDDAWVKKQGWRDRWEKWTTETK